MISEKIKDKSGIEWQSSGAICVVTYYWFLKFGFWNLSFDFCDLNYHHVLSFDIFD